MKLAISLTICSSLTQATHLRTNVPPQAFGYAHSGTSTTSSVSSPNPTILSSSTSAPSTTTQSMENIYDQSPRFKQTTSTTTAAPKNGFGYQTYYHSHHDVPSDRIANTKKMNDKLSDPHFWAKDGGAYDAWKANQARAQTQEQNAADMARFQQQQVEIVKEPAAEEDADGPGDEEDSTSDASGAAAASGPEEDELITAAQERVSTAQTHADTIHTDVEGTKLAIKDTLKESSSHVSEAHEQGPGGEDVLEHLKSAETAARQVINMRAINKKKEQADKDAKAAVLKAKDALDALTEQRKIANNMKNEEQQKQIQFEKDKADAAIWHPGIENDGDANGAGANGEDANAPDATPPPPPVEDVHLSKRQLLFKELGERLLRLAMPSEKRKTLVEHLDNDLTSTKKELNSTAIERTLLAKHVEALEKWKVEEEAKKKGDAASKESKMKPGQQLEWIENELETATQALNKMSPIAQKIAAEAAEAAAKSGEEESKDEMKDETKDEMQDETQPAASLMEEHESPEIVKSIAKDVNVVNEDDDASKPKTVSDLSKTSNENKIESDEMTYATVVNTDPTDDDDAESSTDDDDGNGDDASNQSNNGKQIPEPTLPTDPTQPGQRSVADQVYDALGGDETFDAAERKVNGKDQKASSSSLNIEPQEESLNPSSLAADDEIKSQEGKKKEHDKNQDDPLESARKKLDTKDLPKLSTNLPDRYGDSEEAVARMEIVGAKKDAEVATARVKYAQQRQIKNEQSEQLATAIKMSAQQDRTVDIKKKYLQKANDEELVSSTRLDAADAALQKDPTNNVQRAVQQKLQDVKEARIVVVNGRKQDVEDEERSSLEHRALVNQIQKSIQAEEKKEDELRKARDVQVKEQQSVSEKVADVQAKYGLRHDVQKLISAASPLSHEDDDAKNANNDRRRGSVTPNEDGVVAKHLAKEGKSFTDAAEWRLNLVRTGQAGPIHIPTKSTKEELSASVGAYVGSQRGASLGATHDITAAAASMNVAGVEHYPVLLETSSTVKMQETFTPSTINNAMNDALKEARTIRKKVEANFNQATSENIQQHGILSEDTLARVASLGGSNGAQPSLAVSNDVPVVSAVRFQEIGSSLKKVKQGVTSKMNTKMTTSNYLQKSSNSLQNALRLRQEAEKTWTSTHGGLNAKSGPNTNQGKEGMFHDLPSIKGDRLFAETKQFLTSSNPFEDRNTQNTKNKKSFDLPMSNQQRDMFLENSAQYTTGAILEQPRVAAVAPEANMPMQMQQQQPMMMGRSGQQKMMGLTTLVAEGILPDVGSALPDIM